MQKEVTVQNNTDINGTSFQILWTLRGYRTKEDKCLMCMYLVCSPSNCSCTIVDVCKKINLLQICKFYYIFQSLFWRFPNFLHTFKSIWPISTMWYLKVRRDILSEQSRHDYNISFLSEFYFKLCITSLSSVFTVHCWTVCYKICTYIDYLKYELQSKYNLSNRYFNNQCINCIILKSTSQILGLPVYLIKHRCLVVLLHEMGN